KRLAHPAQITLRGIGFFDVEHGTEQDGKAPNNIELHPVIALPNGAQIVEFSILAAQCSPLVKGADVVAKSNQRRFVNRRWQATIRSNAHQDKCLMIEEKPGLFPLW